MEANAIDRYDLYGAGDHVLNFLDFMAKLVVGLHDLVAVFVERLAFLGQCEFFFAPFHSRVTK